MSKEKNKAKSNGEGGSKAKKNFFSRVFSEVLELPDELALDMPKITLVGNVRLDIENHKGIINYSQEMVKLKVSNGFLGASGKNLTLKNISKDEVSLAGEIRTISIVLDGNDDVDIYDFAELIELDIDETEADKTDLNEFDDTETEIK